MVGTAGAANVAPCLNGWRGSSCDVCTSLESDGQSCADVLDCYAAGGGFACDYAKPTSDAAVMAAHSVLACRCPQ